MNILASLVKLLLNKYVVWKVGIAIYGFSYKNKIKIGFDFWNQFDGFQIESIIFLLKIHSQN
jgi:hypothetical protein